MEKIQQNEAESIAAIANSPEFRKFIDWLDRSRSSAVQGMVRGETDHLRSQASGSYKALDDIIQMSETASRQVDDIRRRQSKIQDPNSVGFL